MSDWRRDLDLKDRMTTLEVKFDGHATQLSRIEESQEKMDSKLDKLFLTMAEARGAGKLAKVAASIIGLLGGIIGSIGYHAAIK